MATLIPKDEYQEIVKVMPIVCVDIVAINESRQIGLVQRHQDPAKGELWLPGGRIRHMETIEGAAQRLAMEDIPGDYDFRQILGVEETFFPRSAFGEHDYHTVNVIVLMKTTILGTYFKEDACFTDMDKLPLRTAMYVRYILDKYDLR